MMEAAAISEDWSPLLDFLSGQAFYRELASFVQRERELYEVFPPSEDVYRALAITGLHDVRVVILGQDPYHDVGQAHGLAFSVNDNIPLPPSLRNILIELQSDLGVPPPKFGNLTPWARQGVLLLNSVLTVRSHVAGSHRGKGWETVTDEIITKVSNLPHPVAFVLWGAAAQAKRLLIDSSRHLVIESPHPSPLSAYRGFFGSRPFSRINTFLLEHGEAQIEWDLQDG